MNHDAGRDEAHRFGITFHRSLRSVARVKKASLEELTAAVGKKQAEIIYQHYHNTLL